MHCKILVKLTLLIISLLAGILPAGAQVFWSESFSNEGLAYAHWLNGGVNPGLTDWTWTNDPSAGYQDPDLPAFAAPSAADGYFLFDSENNGLVSHDVTLTGAGVLANCSGRSHVRLRFYTQYIYFNPSGTLAQIGVSTDGQNFIYKDLFAGLPANLPYHDWVEVDLAEADNQPQVWLQFRWIGRYEYHWKVDDLTLYTLPTPGSQLDSCEAAFDLTAFFGQTPGVPQVTGIFDNTTATASPADPEVSCWNEAGNNGLDILNTTMWYSFTGDGDVYDIQTVPCSATNYIGSVQSDTGDTQILVFEGPNCLDLTPVQCNDDLFPTGMPDFRAGVTLETSPGKTYYMLIDGFDNQGVVATGEFCVQITRQLNIPCSEGQVGTVALDNNGYLCANENLTDILSIDAGGYTLPTVGQLHGIAWCFSTAPLAPGTWPGNVPGIASTPFSETLTLPALLNNGASLTYGKYYLTPVVLGGGALLNSGTLPYIFNVDPAGGCFFIGQSVPLILLPPLAPLAATAQVTGEVIPPGNNGAIVLNVTGGAAGYLNDAALNKYTWSNGKTSRDLNGLANGAYTVTISDATGCTPPIVLMVSVALQPVNAPEQDLVRFFRISPNPAQDVIHLEISLKHPADVRVDLLDALGRVLNTIETGTLSTMNLPIHLEHLPEGLYLVRVKAANYTVQRLFVIQR